MRQQKKVIARKLAYENNTFVDALKTEKLVRKRLTSIFPLF